MELIEYCTESEEQNGCLGAEWLLVQEWFTVLRVGCLGAAVAGSAQHHDRGWYLLLAQNSKCKV